MEAMEELLDHLIGSWRLRGEMGSVSLHQHVEGRRVLGGLFVELRFRELDGHPYEAIYYVGYNGQKGAYVLHLLDSTGVALEPRESVAIGHRVGDAISFQFDDEIEPFTNRFTWHPDDDAWTFDLTSEREGIVSVFATKRMERASA